MTLFTTALGLYGGVLWSGKLQGFIVRETMPRSSPEAEAGGQRVGGGGRGRARSPPQIPTIQNTSP
jgi:hypothetical protein